MWRSIAVTTLTVVGSLGAAGAAQAAPPQYPHGVGVCMSQVAIQPDLAGADRLGQLVSESAGKQANRNGVPTLIADLRGDGPGGCGAPPGPGHLE